MTPKWCEHFKVSYGKINCNTKCLLTSTWTQKNLGTCIVIVNCEKVKLPKKKEFYVNLSFSRTRIIFRTYFAWWYSSPLLEMSFVQCAYLHCCYLGKSPIPLLSQFLFVNLWYNWHVHLCYVAQCSKTFNKMSCHMWTLTFVFIQWTYLGWKWRPSSNFSDMLKCRPHIHFTRI